MRLRLSGSSLSQIARELEVSAAAVTYVSKGISRSERIEQHIASFLETTPSSIWPARYSKKEVSKGLINKSGQ